ncbi:MAG: hypothetical protein HYV32_02550 [Candidatus Kerfeldbacteria bacterium]|nr:hypothetical protein [Candidatus Kerfeldbacteria bacterium]
MNILLIATIISCIGCSTLAIYAWKFNREKLANRYFALMSGFLALWVLVFYISLLHYHIFLVRLTMFIIVLFLLYTFLFVYSFVFEKLSKRVFRFLTTFAIVNAVLALSPFQFTHSEMINGIIMPMPGWGMIIFAVYCLGAIFGSCVLLFKNLRVNDVVKRTQTQFILYGFLITFGTLIFTNLYAVDILHTRKFFPLTMLSTLGIVSCSAYAMTRYRFLDVRIVFKKSIVYGGLLFIFASLYIVSIFSVYRVVESEAHIHPFIWLIVAMLLFLWLFERGKVRIKHFLDGIFFREEIDFFKLIHESNLVLNSTHELESFIIKLAGSIQEVIQAPVEEILVQQEHMHRLKSFFPTHSKWYVAFDEPVIAELIALRRGYLFLDELQERNMAPSVQRLMKKKKAEICMVVMKQSRLLVLVFIGQHKNHKQFTRRDIRGLKEFHDSIQHNLPHLLYWQKTIEGTKVFLQQKNHTS